MDPSEIRSTLDRILNSRTFAQSPRMRRFLAFTVEEALAGQAGSLKEAVIGAAVFDRPSDYDPRVDPIVRVEARRLRAKLASYYKDSSDAIRIELPVGTYAPVFHQSAAPAAAPGAPLALAVLPFESLAAHHDDDFFAVGLSQELIHYLTRLPGLRVMAWNSSLRLQADPGLRQQQVDAWLEGSVRRADARVRINVQLVDPRTRVYLWTASYDREIRDLLAVQEELAQAISAALALRLTHPDAPPLASPPVDAEAYSLYLRGRHALADRTEEGMRQSVFCFQGAIRRDPSSALGHAGLATAYVLLCDYGFERSGHMFELARASARRALELDPASAEAHNALAGVCAKHDWDWPAAEAHFRQAVRFNPGYASAHHWFAVDCLALRGRMEEARAEMVLGRQLNPLDPLMHSSEGYFEYLARNPVRAEQCYAESLRLGPDHGKAWSGLGRALAFQGRYQESLDAFGRARFLQGEDSSVLSAMGQTLGLAGQPAEASQCLNLLTAAASHRHIAHVRFALVHLGLGELDDALRHLEAALEAREPQLTALGVHPAYDTLRGEPRFERLVRLTGFPS